MTPGADDLIGLSEAVRLSGRSARTLRRWIAAGRLRDWRPPGHEPTAPIALRAGDLRALLATEPPPRRGLHLVNPRRRSSSAPSWRPPHGGPGGRWRALRGGRRAPRDTPGT
jgi:hypothetical protein